MPTALSSFPAWLLYLFVVAAPLVPAVAATAAAASAAPGVPSVALQQGSETMAATALDFREMMRKERELAMKKRTVSPTTATQRYLSKRRTRLDLKHNYHVEGGVDGIYYVPGFVTSSEGRRLEKAARSGGGSGGGGGGPEWKELYMRRLQIHGGTPHPSGMVEEELPPFLREVCDALVEAGVFPASSPPNHVLLNEYSSGQGIGPHKDGPLYEGRVAILSLGREACLDFWGSLEDAKADCAAIAAIATGAAGANKNGADDTGSSGCQRQAAAAAAAAAKRALASVRCEDCSLVVFEGAAYYDAWHGIASIAGAKDSTPETTSAVAAANISEAAAPPKAKEAVASGGMASGEEGSCESGADVAAAKDAQGVATERGTVDGDATGFDVAAHREEAAPQKRLSFTIRRVARVVPADSVMEHAEGRSEMERRRRGFERSVTETGAPAPATAAAAAPKD